MTNINPKRWPRNTHHLQSFRLNPSGLFREIFPGSTKYFHLSGGSYSIRMCPSAPLEWTSLSALWSVWPPAIDSCLVVRCRGSTRYPDKFQTNLQAPLVLIGLNFILSQCLEFNIRRSDFAAMAILFNFYLTFYYFI